MHLLTQSEHTSTHLHLHTHPGPHRKLLPLLRRYYKDDVLLVNIDDDMGYKVSNGVLT
jgi:hypothetical protein